MRATSRHGPGGDPRILGSHRSAIGRIFTALVGAGRRDLLRIVQKLLGPFPGPVSRRSRHGGDERELSASAASGAVQNTQA
jgi:hypothetical protein